MEMLLHQTQVSLDQRDQFIFSLRMEYKAKTRDLQSRFARWRESYIGSASVKNSTHGPPQTLSQLEHHVDTVKLFEDRLQQSQAETSRLKDENRQLQVDLAAARVKADLFGEMRELIKHSSHRGMSEKILQWQNNVFEMRLEKMRLENQVQNLTDDVGAQSRDFEDLEKKFSLLENQLFNERVYFVSSAMT